MLPLCLIVAAADAGAAAAGGDTPAEAGAESLSRAFERLGLKPYTVRSLASALGMVGQWTFDAVLIDGSGRSESVLPAIGQLRQRCQAPIVLLAPEAGERGQIEALQGGATEVIATPASPSLIAAKVQRLVDIARLGADAGGSAEERRSVVGLGPLRLDPRRATAAIAGRAMPLTGGEFELLLLLASRPGEFVHRDAIARTLGRGGDGRRSADMHVCRIRKKLRQAGAAELSLETVYGRGYCLRLQATGSFDLAAGPSRERFPQWTV